MESPKKKQQKNIAKRAGFASQQARWATTNGSSGDDLGDEMTSLERVWVFIERNLQKKGSQNITVNLDADEIL